MTRAADIMLAVPTRGQVQYQTVEALNAIRDTANSTYRFTTDRLDPIAFVQGSLSVAQTRNRIVKHFLASDKRVLIMVDDDVVPPPNLLDLAKYVSGMNTYAMVGLPYVMWHQAIGFHLSVYDDAPGGIRPRGLFDGMNVVDCIGTGCTAFPREAFSYIGHPPFEFSAQPGEEDLSEDIIFCRRQRALGRKIGCLWTGVAADHAKTMGLGALFTAQQTAAHAS